jgi:hypothetical protein
MTEATRQAERNSERSERVVKAWTDAQMKIWEGWVDTLQATATGRSRVWDELRKTTLETLEQSVDKTLDAQAELSHVVAESLADLWSTDDKEERARLAELGAVAKSATEAQKQLWTAWFDTAKKFPLPEVVGSWHKVVDAWQTTVRKAVETQAQWYDVQAQQRGRTGAKSS